MGRSGANAEPLNTIFALDLSGHLGMTSPDMTLKKMRRYSSKSHTGAHTYPGSWTIVHRSALSGGSRANEKFGDGMLL